MEKIKVQLDFNISNKIHTLYHSFFNNPPKKIKYSKSEFLGINERTYSSLGKLYKTFIKIFPPFEKLKSFVVSLLRKKSTADLIHFTFHLGETNQRCVIDYEHAYNFIDIRDINNEKNKKRAIKILNKKNVKYLMPIHEEALKSFKLFFGDKIKKPQEVIYPTLYIPEEHRQEVKKKKRVIFISTSNILDDKIFLIKGGLETLRAFESLSKKYQDYEFVILGKIPTSFVKKSPKNLKLINGVPREEMWKMFNESQIFVQPSYHVPAMAYLEAMFFKLPIITTKFWGNIEYVDDKNGIIVDSKYPNHIDENNVPFYSEEILEKIRKNSDINAKKIEKAINKLIKNPRLRKKLGENGFKRVTEGKFFIKRKNQQLRKIYEEAMK